MKRREKFKELFRREVVFEQIRERQGSVVVLVAICMVMFLGFSALVSDAGILYLQKGKLVNAVDAAVMAGAQELPESSLKAKQFALNYGVDNGLGALDLEVVVDSDSRGMFVKASKKVNLFFAKIFGFSTGTVQASARAKIAGVTSAKGVTPLAIEEQEFIFGQEYTLKEGHGVYGWFGPLSLGVSGSNQYEDNMKYGYQQTLRVGDLLPTETGNMSGGTRRGIEYRISRCPHGGVHTDAQTFRDCPMILIIPVIAAVPEGSQPKTVQVLGFAAFLAKEVTGNGHESIIKGTFLRTVIPGDVDFNQRDYGVRGVKLTN